MVTIQIKNRDEAIGDFLLLFRGVIRAFAPDPVMAEQVEHAVSELLNNAQEHGNRLDPDRRIKISWTTGECLRITVEDEGDGFEPVIATAPPPLGQRRGRGLWSIQADGTELSFNEKGNAATLVFQPRTGLLCEAEKSSVYAANRQWGLKS